VWEIGPFDRPAVEFLHGPGVVIDYADDLDTAELMARARTIPERNPDTVPLIRYVLSNGGYGQIKSQYDAVVSQHCLEHQPDLVAHLQQVARLLNPHGIYLCSIPLVL
jgi:SAM-dependent methyltransferase